MLINVTINSCRLVDCKTINKKTDCVWELDKFVQIPQFEGVVKEFMAKGNQ
jgi:hypothetical protein